MKLLCWWITFSANVNIFLWSTPPNCASTFKYSSSNAWNKFEGIAKHYFITHEHVWNAPKISIKLHKRIYTCNPGYNKPLRAGYCTCFTTSEPAFLQSCCKYKYIIEMNGKQNKLAQLFQLQRQKCQCNIFKITKYTWLAKLLSIFYNFKNYILAFEAAKVELCLFCLCMRIKEQCLDLTYTFACRGWKVVMDLTNNCPPYIYIKI